MTGIPEESEGALAELPAPASARVRGVLLVEANLNTGEITYAAPGALVGDPAHQRAALLRFALGVGGIRDSIGNGTTRVHVNAGAVEE